MKKTIFLWSYMRPEMTAATIQKTLKWPGLKNLIVVIDGLRLNAGEEEASWRLRTIREVELAAITDARVQLWLYEDNIGNTNHIMRVHRRAIEYDEYGIWLEEDIDLDLDTYSKIQDLHSRDGRPYLLTGFSQCNHGSQIDLKNTLFVPLWGQTINQELFHLVEKTWVDKKFDSKVVEHVFGEVFSVDKKSHPRYFDRVLKYWLNYSEWGIRSSRRWDALANYSLWTTGNFATSTTERIAHDVSYKDFRGMNQRSKPVGPQIHNFEIQNSGEYGFCLNCERIGSRQEPNNFRRIKISINYRVSRLAKSVTRNPLANQWYSD